MDSIGQILKSGRETRGLSLDEVHEATKVTVQNLSALEDDRFDYFPNRVYARAFLRDYSNFLGLDSPSLLSRHEDEWNPEPEEVVVSKSQASAWRVLGYTVLVLVIMAGLCAAGYFGWNYYEQRQRIAAKPPAQPSHVVSNAVPPSVDDLPPPKPPPPAPPPKPAPPVPVPKPAPQGLVLDVTAVQAVWVGIKADGRTVFQGTIPAGQTKSFQARSRVKIRAGMAGAVQMKLNGKPQASLGTLREVGDKTFTLADVSD